MAARKKVKPPKVRTLGEAATKHPPGIDVDALELDVTRPYPAWGVRLVVIDAWGETKSARMTIDNARDLIAALGAAIAEAESNVAVDRRLEVTRPSRPA